MMTLALLLALAAPGWAGLHSFPSGDSSVVGSTGFVDGEQIGYFWSASRGHRVVETFADPLTTVNRAIFDLAVSDNFLDYGAFVDWDILLNSTVVGDFAVPEGFTGALHLDLSFAPIVNVGGQYTVSFVVTNELATGGGAHALAYAGGLPHTVELLGDTPAVPLPASVFLGALGLSCAGSWLRRKVA
jgi:hypothetical protein